MHCMHCSCCILDQWDPLGSSLRSQPMEDTGLSPDKAVYGVPLTLPNEFLQVEEFSADQIADKFSKVIDTPAFSLPGKHNSGQQLLDEIPVDPSGPPASVPGLGTLRQSCPAPCSGLTTAPTQCCAADRAPSPSGLGTGRRSSPPAISSPARTIRLSWASNAARADCPAPVRKSSQPTDHQGDLPATKWVSFSDLLTADY